MNTDRPRPIKTVSTSDKFALYLYLFGIYTSYHITSNGSLLVPYAISLLAFPILFAKYKEKLNIYIHLILVGIIFITILGIFYNYSSSYVNEYFKGLIQLIYSIVLSILFFFHLKKTPIPFVSKFFFLLTIFVLVGCTLEVLFPFFRSISENFVEVYLNSVAEKHNYRDIALFGSIRPRLFTTEPSYVAINFTFFLWMWFSTSVLKYKFKLFWIFLIIAIILIKSPIILISVPLMILTEEHSRKVLSTFSKQRNNLFIYLLGFSLLLISSISFIYETRYEMFKRGDDKSANVRIIAPLYVVIETFKVYPFFGSGITSKEANYEIIAKVNSELNSNESQNANFIGLFFMYYGILGSILFIILLLKLFNLLGLKKLNYTFLYIIMFGMTQGNFVGLRCWTLILSSAFITYVIENKQLIESGN